MKAVKSIAAGNVISQTSTMELIVNQFPRLVARPLRQSEPHETCVVDIGTTAPFVYILPILGFMSSFLLA